MEKTTKEVLQVKCIGDLLNCRYIKVIGEGYTYAVKRIGDWGEIGIYESDYLVGYVHNTKIVNGIEIRRKVHGLDFVKAIEYKHIIGFK